MRRIDFRSNRRNRNTVFWLLAGLIIFLVFLFTAGFNFLLNASLYIANRFSNNETADVFEKNEVFGSVSIDEIPVATNSPKIMLSGSLSNYSHVFVYLNNRVVKEKDLENIDVFNFEIEGLEKGENTVYVKAKTKDGKNSRKTEKHTVFFSDEKPKIEITDPSFENGTVNKDEIIIKGNTNKEVVVKINGLPVVVGVGGDFSHTVRLNEGENTITVSVLDKAGNSDNKILKVNYQKD